MGKIDDKNSSLGVLNAVLHGFLIMIGFSNCNSILIFIFPREFLLQTNKPPTEETAHKVTCLVGPIGQIWPHGQ